MTPRVVRAALVLTCFIRTPGLATAQQRPARTLTAFQSAAELAEFLRRPPDTARRRAATPQTWPTLLCDGSTTLQPAIIRGRVTADSAGESVAGANVYVNEAGVQAPTDSTGRFRLEVPGRCLPEPRSLAVRVRAIGYRPDSRTVSLQQGDSLIVEFALKSDVNRLDEIVVSAGLVQSGVISITNVQTQGVDEGDIVKLHGNFLVMLRRGRLFTVRVGANDLRPVTALDAFGPGIDPERTWYDELLIAGDKIVVVGYSYERGGTELGIFRIDRFGGLSHQGTYQLTSNDYYSSRNYASRLIGSKLVFYTPMYFDSDAPRLPAMRRWSPEHRGTFRDIVTAQRVYRPSADWRPGDDAAMHTVTSCDLALAELTCQATVLLGPPGRVFYVSGSAVYVWMSEWRTRWAAGRREPSVLARLPLDGSAPTSIRVNGSPIDQFSFLESGDGFVNVLVGCDANGDAMWNPEKRAGGLALLRLPIDSLADGSRDAGAAFYRPLPIVNPYALTNRFVGQYLVYGTGSGWRLPKDGASSPVYATRWRGGPVVELRLDHGADRIEIMGRDAIVVGADQDDLHFSAITLSGRPALAQRYTMVNAAQGETRSHGFFYRDDGPNEGVIGLPVAGGGRAGWRQLFEGSAGVLYLQNAGRNFTPLGLLSAEAKPQVSDGCKASCVDWYGNARPIFLGGRVLALLGYELVEGRIDEGRIREMRRINYAPTAMTAMNR